MWDWHLSQESILLKKQSYKRTITLIYNNSKSVCVHCVISKKQTHITEPIISEWTRHNSILISQSTRQRKTSVEVLLLTSTWMKCYFRDVLPWQPPIRTRIQYLNRWEMEDCIIFILYINQICWSDITSCCSHSFCNFILIQRDTETSARVTHSRSNPTWVYHKRSSINLAVNIPERDLLWGVWARFTEDIWTGGFCVPALLAVNIKTLRNREITESPKLPSGHEQRSRRERERDCSDLNSASFHLWWDTETRAQRHSFTWPLTSLHVSHTQWVKTLSERSRRTTPSSFCSIMMFMMNDEKVHAWDFSWMKKTSHGYQGDPDGCQVAFLTFSGWLLCWFLG